MSTTPKLGKAFLVTGTDLDVGKTFISTGLARLLKNRGLEVGVMKPVEIGWPKEGGEWSPDADALRQAAEIDDPPSDVVPYVFEEMIAPQIAADRTRNPILPERIKASLDRLRAKYDVVVVEGVGGVAVPLDDGFDFAALAKYCELPLLIVARAHMGTLNPTYLTVHYAKACELDILGIVANRLDRSMPDPTVSTNTKMMERMCGVPVLGLVPDDPKADSLEDVVALCTECFDVARFLDLLGIEV